MRGVLNVHVWSTELRERLANPEVIHSNGKHSSHADTPKVSEMWFHTKILLLLGMKYKYRTLVPQSRIYFHTVAPLIGQETLHES